MNKQFKNEKDQSLTYLEFGSIQLEKGEKTIWDFRIDQEAYDFLMLSRYAKELLAFESGVKDAASGNINSFAQRYSSDVHTQDYLNTIFAWTALSQTHQERTENPVFLELGSTIFGCIEAFESWRAVCGNGPSVKNIKFRGLEISDYLARLGERLHTDYDIQTWLDPSQVDWTSQLFFAKGVSLLYAVRNAEDLLLCLQHAEFGLFDYNFSLSELQTDLLGTGKQVSFIPLKDFLGVIKGLPQKLYVRCSDARLDSDKGRARCYFIWGKPEKVSSWLTRVNLEIESLRSRDSSAAKKLLNGYSANPMEDYVEVDSTNIGAILLTKAAQ